MKQNLTRDTLLLTDKVLPELEINRHIGYDEATGEAVLEKNVLDRILDEDRMMDFLRNNPKVANELVSYEGPIVYMGRYRSEVGMNFLSRSGTEMEGSNTYGIFLEKCRDRYIKEMRGQIHQEKPVRPDQVTVDYTSAGAEATDIELLERGGSDRYLHVGLYRPATFQHDADLSGTSGHAQRASASDVKFQTFECPFGTTRKHKISVGSAAEASMYYEQALRGELDWKALFNDLRERKLVRGVTPAEEARLIGDMKAQFSWMRERILRDNSLAGKTIVADSLVVADKSMGRSVYHPEFAPSPAHVLARYINNPHLLYTGSENGVVRALERSSKEESVRFGSLSGRGEITIVVDGSDTIGGRVPGSRAVATKKSVPKRDSQGRVIKGPDGKAVYEIKDIKEFEFKSQAETDADFAAFSERMDSILMNIDPNVKVRFVTGTNVGTDKMLMQYVEKKGGNVYDWNYTKGGLNNTAGHENKAKDARFSVVRMRNFQNVYPVLVGREDSATFNLNEMLDDSEVRFASGDIVPDGFVSFSVSQDSWNARILERGSLAAASGKPFLHVMENYTEKEQIMELDLASETAKFALLGEPSYKDSLFGESLKTEWDLGSSSVMSHMPSGQVDIAIPFVANRYDASVYVNGVPFNSVYGVYCGLMMKNAGIDDRQAYRDLVQASDGMISMQQVFDRYMAGIDVGDAIKEKCMRNAVHMMSHASNRFADSLLSTGSSDIVCVSSFGDPSLFTGLDGKGENRFGVVMMNERSSIKREMEIAMARDAEQARRTSAELLRRQKRVAQRAPGEKIATGLPRTSAEATDGVWFLGTSQPVAIALPQDNPSFVLWEEGYQEDILNREKASRPFIEDVMGNRIPNDYVYLFPSNLTAVASRFPMTTDPNQRDLTGVTRVDPKTGEEFVCAYGIAVKRNREFYEHDNKFGKPCSFLLDNDGAILANSIYTANAEARAVALDHGMALCYSAYSTRTGDLKDSLSRVFEPKIWDYERTKEIFDRHTGKITQEGGVIVPKEVVTKTYNKATRTVEYNTELVRKKSWVDNPHAAPKNLEMVKRYEAMLENGRQYPLTCFSMPRLDYEGVSPEVFMSDLIFSLNMANATALATGKPLRFPLDENGRINLGPGIPEEFRDMAERRIDHYIGVVQNEGLIEGKIPVINRISVWKAHTNDRPLERDGSDIILRPNDLLVAFGRYDFHDILVGNRVPLHEMAFADENGNIFKLTDTRLSSKFTAGELNKYLSYERNDECRFNVRSTDTDKIPEFLQALKSYIARAKEIEVEYKLFSEAECLKGTDGVKDLSQAGYVHLLASNEENYDLIDKHVVSARPNETMVEMDPDWIDVRGRQGREDDNVYAGKEVANDGFKGWAMYRYKLPDGTQSDWKTVDDLELAKDIVLHSTHRVYKTDTRITPSEKVINATLKSLAVKDCGNLLFNMEAKLPEVKVDDKVVALPEVPQQEMPAVNEVNIHFGNGDNPELSNFAIRPFADELFVISPEYGKDCFQSMEQAFQYCKSYYSQAPESEISQYRKNILATTDGKELRALGRSLPQLDTAAWDKESPDVMRKLIRSSFEQNPEAKAALLATGDAKLTHRPDDSRWGELFPEILTDVRHSLAIQKNNDIVFTESAGGYQKRTLENAQAYDVDFTLAFATDFSTHGEKATARAAGDSLIAVDLPLKAKGGLNMSASAVRKVAGHIIDCLPDEFAKGQPFGVNIAGNGIYTLAKEGISQQDIDQFMCAVGVELTNRGVQISSVRSGGQTGVDEAGAAMGKALEIPTTVHAPKGWVFRGENGKDVTNDQEAFKNRFAAKDYGKLASTAKILMAPKVTMKPAIKLA